MNFRTAGVFATGLVGYTGIAIALAPLSLNTNNAIFGADTREIAATMTHVTFDGDMHRHPLFSLITAPIVNGLQFLPWIDEHRAILLTLGLIAATNLTLAWVILNRLLASKIVALFLTVMYGLMFSNLVLWSIPETYALAGVAILAFFWLFLRHLEDATFQTDALIGVSIGLAGLVNPPLLSLLVIVVVYQWLNAESISEAVAHWFASAIGLFLVGYALTGGLAGVEHTVGTAEKWGSLANLLDLKQWLFVCLSFFVGSVVSPVSTWISSDVWLHDFLSYQDRPWAWFALSCWLVVAIFGLAMAIYHKDPLVLPILSWVAVMVTFYVYFNPHEAMLYSSQCLFPLLIVSVRGLNRAAESIAVTSGPCEDGWTLRRKPL
jgi:hypothetical protein